MDFINYGMNVVNMEVVDSMLQEFLDTHCVDSVQFSYTEYDPTDGTGEGTRTTIEKVRYTVEDLDS